MTDFVAGQKLRPSQLNPYVIFHALCSADTTKNANTTLGDITGMSASLEASSTYIFWGYVAYSTGSTPDIKFAFSVPSGATGHWALHGVSSGSTNPGSLDATHATSFGATTLAAAGDTEGLMVRPTGYIVTTNAGTIQMQFAQNSSDASDTTVKAGSWIAFQKVA